jgi:tripartite-type tricarboxylate transporter receptor subunit TctC
MLRLNRRMTLVLAVTALAPLASVAQAPAFPSKPITLVVPFPAGGPNDILARAIAERVGPALKQTIIVDNRAGATGNIGAQAVVSRSGGRPYPLAHPGHVDHGQP